MSQWMLQHHNFSTGYFSLQKALFTTSQSYSLHSIVYLIYSSLVWIFHRVIWSAEMLILWVPPFLLVLRPFLILLDPLTASVSSSIFQQHSTHLCCSCFYAFLISLSIGFLFSTSSLASSLVSIVSYASLYHWLPSSPLIFAFWFPMHWLSIQLLGFSVVVC